MLKYIVIDSDSEASRAMFADVKKLNNAMETSNLFQISNPLLRIINKIHMSGKVNSIIPLPFQKIWDCFYITEIAKKHPETEHIVLTTNVSVRKFRREYLQQLATLPNIHLVLVAVDSFIDQKLCPLDIMKDIDFELIYSFDKEDCKNHGLIHTEKLYSVCEHTDEDLCSKADLFFVGRAKGRLELILEIARKAINQGMKINFNILGVNKADRVKIPGVHYINKVIQYDKVLSMIHASKCLVDVVQKGQKGLTMRAYEAVLYNKKVITNNETVKSMEYYNEGNMLVFEDVDQLDFQVLNISETADYGYKGEYSPINLLRDIETRLKCVTN